MLQMKKAGRTDRLIAILATTTIEAARSRVSEEVKRQTTRVQN